MSILDRVGQIEDAPFRRILVTGADGFVGTHLVAGLVGTFGDGVEIIPAVRQPNVGERNQIAFELGDARSIDRAIATALPDAIVHLAAQASVMASATTAAKTWETNFLGTMTLAQAVATHAPECTFLFASSAEVYGATLNLEVASEQSALRPLSVYARSKAATEAMLGDVLPPTCRLIIARPSNHSGAGQTSAFVLPTFARQIAEVEGGVRDTISVGRLDSRRDFLAVEDVVRAYLIMIAHARNLPARSVFNVASGEAVAIGELLSKLLAMAHRPALVTIDPTRLRPSEVETTRLANDAIAALGWRPAVPIDDMLQTVLDFQRSAIKAEYAARTVDE